jgi:hypothetical protein
MTTTVRRSNEQQGGRGWRWGGLAAAATVALAATAIITSCDDDFDDDAEVVSASYVYPYDYYYPADLAVSDAYWMDPWYYDPFYFIKQAAQTTDSSIDAASVMRALATGVSVCGSQASVVPRFSTSCLKEGGVGEVRSGATISFNGCMLSNGGRIDGTVDITGAPTISDQNCDANTVVNVNYTSRYTNLTYTAPDGSRVVVPDATNVGSFTRKGNAGPGGLSVTVSGNLLRYDASNALLSNHGVSGSRNFRFTDGGYVTNGTVAVQDALGGSQATLTGVELTRSRDCCRPISGNVVVAGRERATDTWSFGPNCGDASLNGSSASLPACQ